MKRLCFVLAAALVLLAPGANAQVDGDAVSKRYVVVFNQPNGLPSGAAAAVGAAGGSVVLATEQVGALLAESSDPAFADKLRRHAQVKAVDENVSIGIPEELDAGPAPAEAENNGGTYAPPGPDPQPGTEPLYFKQWDKMRVNASDTGSYAVQRGNRAVRVAILDTGVEVTHPDLIPNLNFAESRAFVSPAGTDIPADPNPAQWDDKHGHGSWCASAVASPINAFGISGVAPDVQVVALKVLGDTGRGSFFGVARALVYAGDMKMDVASMSLSGVLRHADGGNAVWIVVQRAIQYARSQGVMPIAAMGNANWNLADGSFFRDYVVSPVEHAGVVGVTATGYYNQKSFYSSYGVGKADVSAPGGATRYQNPPPPYESLGRVLGAWAPESIGSVSPAQREEQCAPPSDPTGGCHYYAYIQGTSMATPNAAGVAALIISQYGRPQNDDPWYMSPTAVESHLQTTANNQPCPEGREVFYPDIPGFSLFRPNTATCQGDVGYNGFYGKGMVDALKAVTK
jgi:lantibiotic leader peptide-processing serine protease